MSSRAETKDTKKTDMTKGTGGIVQDVLNKKGSNFYKCRKDDTVYMAIQEMVSAAYIE